ncbi:MAG: DUF3761 domain-containing protein [Massilia sp.]
MGAARARSYAGAAAPAGSAGRPIAARRPGQGGRTAVASALHSEGWARGPLPARSTHDKARARSSARCRDGSYSFSQHHRVTC